ncbi:hypothetical protein HNQ51_000133 [Inhella inkyongensis]|uniref:Uncharacterized protein n=1 Tax=Inhella inkyongensis TaxID=392593 RepID=A0A840S2M0_9BURK|nr:hypothetical protein [Inhella inkyongensis]MBB5202840.1 hypothetical protein [Inhella inkyongensis]
MHSLRNAQAIDHFLVHAPDPEVRALINERLADLAEFDDFELSDLVNFYVAEPGDLLTDLEHQLGFELSFEARPWDAFQCHATWCELTYVLSDDGFGVVIYIPINLMLTFGLQPLIEAASPCCDRSPNS